METYDFAECCTSRIVDGWGGDHSLDYIFIGNKRVENTYENYKERATKELLECCETLNSDEKGDAFWDDDGDKYTDLRNLALIMITLTTEQGHAIQFAKEVGFTMTRSVAKGRHPERCLKGGWISGKNLFKWYQANKEPKA